MCSANLHRGVLFVQSVAEAYTIWPSYRLNSVIYVMSTGKGTNKLGIQKGETPFRHFFCHSYLDNVRGETSSDNVNRRTDRECPFI